MGGNAFRQMGLESQRMDQETFDRIERAVRFILADEAISRTPGNVKEKTDHGDIDILYTPLNEHAPDFDKIFKDHTRLRNGGQFHVLYEGKFQIDLIHVKSGHFDFNYHYFSNNDLGNILGRMLKRRGFTLKNDGVYYEFREGGSHVKVPVFCSAHWGVVLDILELDKYKYTSSFDTFEQMFEWVYASPYFDASIFQYKNLSSENRRRDSVRPTYNKWLDFCERKPVKPIKKSVTPPEEVFPNIIHVLEDIRAGMELNKRYKERVNGETVSTITGLTGKELGQVMSMIAKYPKKFIVNSDDSMVRKIIIDCWQEWERNNEL